jgi:hypothetical protein
VWLLDGLRRSSSQLVALVPDGAQIVAWIEYPHNPTSSRRLLLVTHNCNLDFNDWLVERV